MGAFNAVHAASAIADRAIREAVASAYQEYRAAIAELERVLCNEAGDLDAHSAALGRALSAWAQLQACARLCTGVSRGRSSAQPAWRA